MSENDMNKKPQVWNAAVARFAAPTPDGARLPRESGHHHRPNGPTAPRPGHGMPYPGPWTPTDGRTPGGRLSWTLVLGLGAIALIRPLARITGTADAVGSPAGPLLLTALVTLAWVAIVGLGRVSRPVATLTLAGVAYGLYVIPLSAILSTALEGSVQGPLAVPFAIIPILVTNALWGAVAGVLALAVQQIRRWGA